MADRAACSKAGELCQPGPQHVGQVLHTGLLVWSLEPSGWQGILQQGRGSSASPVRRCGPDPARQCRLRRQSFLWSALGAAAGCRRLGTSRPATASCPTCLPVAW